MRVRSECLPILLLTCCAWLHAQRAADEVTPAVQQLYAQAHAAQARGDVQTAIADYRRMLEMAPHLAPAYNNLGKLYFDMGQYTEAADTLRKGLRLDPRMGTAQALLGLSEYKLGHFAEARTQLLSAAAVDPRNPDLQMALARTEIASGDAAAGTARLQAYLQLEPKDQEAWYLLGKTYLQLSRDALAEVNAIDPDSASAHLVTGEIDESMRNYDGALAEYTKAERKSPDKAGVHYHLGNALWLQQKWDPAEREFAAELSHNPGDCTSAWKLGNSMLQANESPEDALHALNQAVAACPGLMQARADRGSALLKLNRPKEALDDLLLAERDAPREPSLHFLLSRAYKALGQQEQARSEIETYSRLQQETTAAEAQRARDVLDTQSAHP